MQMTERLTPIEYAYGRGYTDALERVAEDLHTQSHTEFDTNGNGDPRGLAFYETSEVLRTHAKAIRLDNDSRAPIQEGDE